MAVECKKKQLALFDAKPVQYSILSTEQVALKPLSAIEGSTVLSFMNVGYGETYKNMESIYLVLKVKMEQIKDNGEALSKLDSAADLVVAPVNNTLHSLFRQITLTLNGKQIGQNTQNYAYRYI